ncbi:hypothetical protein [Jiella pacifica]|nr:hypothetical protein [Jiella pacifica]
MSETMELVLILERILSNAKRDDHSFGEKAGLAAAAKMVASDIRQAIDEDADGNGYMREKLLKTEYGIVSGLGFGAVGAGDPKQLYDLATSQLHTLKNLVSESEMLR